MKISFGGNTNVASTDVVSTLKSAITHSTKEIAAFITEQAQNNAPKVPGETEKDKNSLKESIKFTKVNEQTFSSIIKSTHENAVRYHEDPTFVTGKINEQGNMEGPKFVERAYNDNSNRIVEFFKNLVMGYLKGKREHLKARTKSIESLIEN